MDVPEIQYSKDLKLLYFRIRSIAQNNRQRMTSQPRILIADDFHPILAEGLKEMGFEVSEQANLDREGILHFLRNGCEVLIMRSKTKADAALFSAAKDMKIFARGGAGMDNVDEDAANSRGIMCINAGEANSDSVGEHAVGMLLDLRHKISKGDREIRAGKWDREGNRGLEIKGKTVGIIGFGNTGSAVARKLQGLEVSVLAYDKYKDGFGGGYVKESNWEEIQKEADVLTLHVPLNGETRQLINKQKIKDFQKPFVLMNLSRGEIVDTSAVVDALEEGKIIGFATDVLENENINELEKGEQVWFQKLKNRQDTVLTPHVAGWSTESYEQISRVILAKIRKLMYS